MITIYFKTAIRQLLKNRLFSIVNIAGLSVGLASMMALSLLVYQYLNTDSSQKDIGQMYYLKTQSKDGSQYAATPYPLLGEIVKSCPEVEAGTHIQSWYYPWLKWKDKEFQETTDFVDTGYFKVFQYPFKYGNAATVLDASVSNITGLLSKDFLFLVCLSIIIATPLAYYVMNNWPQDFAYRIHISGWMFILSGVIAIVIALITVSVQSVKAAIANPVKSLRTE